MTNFYNPIFNIDNEFSRFSFQTSDEYYLTYKQLLQANHLCHPIIVWDGLIVDGHLQYRACQEINKRFTYTELDVKTRNEVIRWRCNQLLNKQCLLTDEQIRYCIGKLYLAEVEHNKYLKCHNLPTPVQQIPRSEASPKRKNTTALYLSKKLHISTNVVLRDSKHARAIDAFFEKCPSIAHAILNEEIRLPLNTMEALANYSGKKLRDMELFLLAANGKHLTIADIKEAFGQSRQTTKTTVKKEAVELPPKIKQMPVFDPNAAISSLIYTMPSWINMIECAMKQTDFSKLSSDAQEKLSQKLFLISETINKLNDEMENYKHE